MKNYESVIININSNIYEHKPIKGFDVNGLIKINNQTIIDHNIEFFHAHNIKVYILINKKFLKLVVSNLINTNYKVLIKEDIEPNNMQLLNHFNDTEKILIIEDDYYIDKQLDLYIDTIFNYYPNQNGMIINHINDLTSNILLVDKKIFKHIDFDNNSIKIYFKNKTNIFKYENNDFDVNKINCFDKLINLDNKFGSDQTFKVFTPGPVDVKSEIKQVLALNTNHHRSYATLHHYQTANKNLKKVFKTKNGFIIPMMNTGSGTTETCIFNLFNKGDKVLVLANGHFGRNLIKYCKLQELDVTTLEVQEGVEFDLKQVAELAVNQKAILMVHMDTSCGVLNPLEAIAKIAHVNNCLLFVDAIASLLNEEFEFDKWNIDLALATSAKGFETIPGLTFICLSQKALTIINENNKIKPWFLDFKTYLERHFDKGLTPGTYAVNLFTAINLAIDLIESNGGLNKLILQKKALSMYLNKELKTLGFKPLLNENITKSSWVSGFLVPKKISALKLRSYLYVVYGYLIELGFVDATDKIIRIAFSHKHNKQDAINLVNAIKNSLKVLKLG